MALAEIVLRQLADIERLQRGMTQHVLPTKMPDARRTDAEIIVVFGAVDARALQV